MPKVSVIIPAYNAMTYLPETLKSVLKQTFTDFEVLIIDDGSTDNIGQWANDLVDSRVKLIVQKNQGASVARNTGIAQAKGEYIAFLDADDLWEPTKLEKQVRYLENNPTVGLVHTNMLLIDWQGQSSGRVMKSNAEGDALKQLLKQNTIVTSSVIVRNDCLKTVGEFDRNLRYSQDWDMWVRIAARYPFAIIKEPLVYYRQHPNNATKNWQMLEQNFGMIEKLFQSVSQELLYLKNRSYGYASIYLAWKALQNGDRQQAIYFRNQAIAHYPQLSYSSGCIRLSVAIAIMQCLGADGFNKVLALIYALRRRFVSIIAQ
ncbi:MAG: glycosyltransferase [Komarekiella atlantica HA4396-MV6]|jgi:glycosyltransferase involved in cell wall biosynthesis|nr:glycosyltransferase [Komarekiella atlantica HA4396-MV6]